MKGQPITIHTPVYVTDSYGNETEEIASWDDVMVSGRVRPTSAREVTSGQQRAIVDAVGVLPTGASVPETAEITVGGKRYRVLGVFEVDAMTKRLKHLHVDLQAVS